MKARIPSPINNSMQWKEEHYKISDEVYKGDTFI